MTVVIGFSFPPFHDNAVGVILDGKLVFASEEERYTRHKHSLGEPCIYSLTEAFRFLQNLGIKPSDVDLFAVNYDPKHYALAFRYLAWRDSLATAFRSGLLDYYMNSKGQFLSDILFTIICGFDYMRFSRTILRKVAQELGFVRFLRGVRIIPVAHHLAHAASAYYFSGFSSSAVLTIDGWGESEATVVWKVKNGEFERVAEVGVDEGSIGLLFQYLAEKLKLGSLDGPGKLMGLAPYGSRDSGLGSKFSRVLDTEGNSDQPYNFSEEFRLKSAARSSKRLSQMYTRLSDYLSSSLDLSWNPKTELSPSAANLAWHTQHFTDDVILTTANWAKEQTNSDKIALAGGVALNAKANMELHYSGIFNDLFILPAANDAGGPIGAAAYVYEHFCGEKMSHGRLENVYLGPEYSYDYVKSVVQRTKFEARYIDNDVRVVSELISKGNIVAWFQGRAELGPRALGNRSIVADPRSRSTWGAVNAIKGREYWRPLAPSVLAEDKDAYFVDPVDHEFMTLMFRLKGEVKDRVPAIWHVDGTARPQTVTQTNNRTWYDLIRCFKDFSGESIAVNTSFNLAEEPLVQTPEEAIRSFSLGAFDALYLQGWLIKKRTGP